MNNSNVKNYVIGALMCVVVALAIGLKPVKRVINEVVKSGSLDGAEACMSYSRGELLSADAVRVQCISAFEKRIFGNDFATGPAGPRSVSGEVSWEGTLRNKTTDHVTTWVQIVVRIYDAEGGVEEFFADTPIWIEPLGEAKFIVEIPDVRVEQFEDSEFCDYELSNRTDCFSWGVSKIKGLSI